MASVMGLREKCHFAIPTLQNEDFWARTWAKVLKMRFFLKKSPKYLDYMKKGGKFA